MYCALVETTGVSGVVGVDGVEGVEGVDGVVVGGVEGVELSGAELSGVELSTFSEEDSSFTVLSDEVGGGELISLSAVLQATAGSKKLSAKSSAAKDFAFFIKYLTKLISEPASM